MHGLTLGKWILSVVTILILGIIFKTTNIDITKSHQIARLVCSYQLNRGETIAAENHGYVVCPNRQKYSAYSFSDSDYTKIQAGITNKDPTKIEVILSNHSKNQSDLDVSEYLK